MSARPQPPATDTAQTRDAHARRTLWLTIFGAVLAIPTVVLAMAMDIAGMHINDDPRLHGWIVARAGDADPGRCSAGATTAAAIPRCAT